MKLYHGTNLELTTLAVGSWVTDDYGAALEFAADKVAYAGGSGFVYEIELDETEIDWDVISMICGIEDNRGTTLTPVNCQCTLIHLTQA